MRGPRRSTVGVFFFSSRRRHTRCSRDWSSDVCSSDLLETQELTPHGIQLLEDTKHLQQERLMILHTELENGVSSPARLSADYEGRRDALMDRISATLQQFNYLHYTGICVGVSRSRESS